MKKFFIALVLLLFVLLIASLAIPFVVDINHFKKPILACVQKKIGRSVHVGHLSWKLLPSLAIGVEDFRLQESADPRSPTVFSAKNVNLALRWAPLFHKTVEVKKVVLVDPKIVVTKGSMAGILALKGEADARILVRQAGGKLSFDVNFRGDDLEFRIPGKIKKVPGEKMRLEATGWLENEKLFLEKATVNISSCKAVWKKTSYFLQTHDFKGELQATLRLEDIQPWMEEAGGGLAEGQAGVDLDFSGNTDRLRDVQIEGTVELDSLRLRWPGLLKQTIEGRGDVQFQKNLVRFRSVELKVGRSDLRLDGKILLKGNEPGQISLESDFLDLGELLDVVELPSGGVPARVYPASQRSRAAVSPSGKSARGVLKALPAQGQAVAGVAGGVLPQIQGLGKWSFQGDCRIGELIFQRNNLKDLRGKLNFTDGVFTLSRFTGTGFRGSFSSALQCDLSDPNFVFRLGMRLADIDINKVLSANSDFSGRVFGRMAGQLEVTGRFAGNLDGLLQSLEGGGNVEIRDMQIATFDMMNNLSLLTGLLGIRQDEIDETRFDYLGTTLHLRAGRVFTPNIQARGNSFDLSGRGSFGFDRTVDYTLSTRLSREMSMRLGKSELVAALLDEEGRMNIPFAVKGRIDGPPEFEPLWQDIFTRSATHKLGEYLQRKVFKRKSPTQEEQPDVFSEPSTPPPGEPPQGTAGEATLEDLLTQILKR